MSSDHQRRQPGHRRLSVALSVVAAGMAAGRVQPSAAQCEVAIITASDAAPYDLFGESVSASGNVAVVGAPRNNDAGGSSGSVYVFRSDGVDWVQEAKLKGGDAAGWDRFGVSVGISGDYIVVGAPEDYVACPADSGSCYSGSAYVFWYDGTSWVEQAKLTASDAAREDRFGQSVAISGSVVVVGGTGGRMFPRPHRLYKPAPVQVWCGVRLSTSRSKLDRGS